MPAKIIIFFEKESIFRIFFKMSDFISDSSFASSEVNEAKGVIAPYGR